EYSKRNTPVDVGRARHRFTRMFNLHKSEIPKLHYVRINFFRQYLKDMKFSTNMESSMDTRASWDRMQFIPSVESLVIFFRKLHAKISKYFFPSSSRDERERIRGFRNGIAAQYRTTAMEKDRHRRHGGISPQNNNKVNRQQQQRRRLHP